MKDANKALKPRKPMPPRPRQSRQQVSAVAKGMDVLKALAAMGGAATLTNLSAVVGESPAKMHRYLASLVASGMVAQDASDARYVLGLEAISIGLAAIRRTDVVRNSEALLRSLAQSLDLSCCLGIPGNAGPIIVRWEEPPLTPVTVNVRIGSVLSIPWSATGRAVAAFAPSKSLDDVIGRELRDASTERRRLLPNRKAFDKMIEEVRAQGCACIRGVLLPHVDAVAVPVFNASSQLAGVITVLGVEGRVDPEPDGKLAGLLKRSAEELSASLGYKR